MIDKNGLKNILRNVLLTIPNHRSGCDCIQCRLGGNIDVAVELVLLRLVSAGFVHKSQVRLDEEKIDGVIRCVDFSKYDTAEMSKGKLCEAITRAIAAAKYDVVKYDGGER